MDHQGHSVVRFEGEQRKLKEGFQGRGQPQSAHLSCSPVGNFCLPGLEPQFKMMLIRQ